MSKLKALTDFFVWLLFIVTLLSTIALLTAGVVEIITTPAWSDLLMLASAGITLGLHYAVRVVPTGGG